MTILVLTSCGIKPKSYANEELENETQHENAVLSTVSETSIQYLEEDTKPTEESNAVKDRDPKGIQDETYLCAGNESGINGRMVTAEDISKALSEWRAKGDNDYFLCPDSSNRLILEKELTGFSKCELWLIRNEIYARHGCDFEDPILKTYFNTQKWYEPVSWQYETIQLNDIEKANLMIIDEMESREQEKADYNGLERLTELEHGKEYLFSVGQSRVELKLPKDDYVDLVIDGKKSGCNIYIHKEDMVLIYNREDKSYLFVSGKTDMNDIILTRVYQMDQSGITERLEYGGYVVSYVKNAFCVYGELECIDRDTEYEWLFLQEEFDWLPKGRATIEKSKYKVTEKLDGYLETESGLSEIEICEGDCMYMVSMDRRYEDVLWIGFIHDGQSVYVPLFEKYGGATYIYADGTAPWEHFEVSEYMVGTIKDGDELAEKALSEWSAKGDNDYYLCPESSSRLILEKELTGFSKYELWLIRNEIAARHGCIFEDPILQSYFDTQKWYEPVSGKYEATELNDIEKANLTMIAEMEGCEQEQVDYHRLEQYIELAFGETYEFHFGDTEIILRPSGDDCVELLENGEKVAEYRYAGENDKLLIYNRKDESYLVFAGMRGIDDITFSEYYRLNRSGATYYVRRKGEVVAYTRDALCMWYKDTLLNCNDTGYIWEFFKGNRIIKKGKAVTGNYEYRVKKEFICYEVGPSGFTEVTVYQGEILRPVNEDYRHYNVLWSEMIRKDRRIILPVFWKNEMHERVGLACGSAPFYMMPVAQNN